MAATPAHLRDRLELICANLETWRPTEPFDLVIGKDVLHHLNNLEDWFEAINTLLGKNGLFYVSEFVGPSRFQWTDKQLGLVNRLLERLSPELRYDLVACDGSLRPLVTRPNLARFAEEDPSEAVRSSELPTLLHNMFETVEEHSSGGAIYHLLFNSIMGNFAEYPDLVRILMEIDAILTDEGVVQNNYLWGVYRAKALASTPST